MDVEMQQALERALSDGDVDAFKRVYEQNPQYRVRVCLTPRSPHEVPGCLN